MATKPNEPAPRRALPPHTWRRADAARPRRRRDLPSTVTILERRDYLEFKGEGGVVAVHRDRLGDAIEVLVAILDLVDEPWLDCEPDEDHGVEDGRHDPYDREDSCAAEDYLPGSIPLASLLDPNDADDEDNGDTELNGDEGDYSETPGMRPPEYGVDQTVGPINELTATKTWARDLQAQSASTL